MDSKITITWHGHSCFSLSADGYTLVLDPYDDSLEGYAPLCLFANEVLCSHGHHDHAWLPAVSLEKADASPFALRAVKTWHDDCQGKKRGENLVHVVNFSGKKLVHCGDLGHLLTPEQIAQIGPCDVLMVPVGGFYTIDAVQARQVADQLRASVVIPMHYRFGQYGIPVIGEVEDFLALAGDLPVRRYPGSQLILEEDTPRQIAVLRYQEDKIEGTVKK
ncbi:MAG: MBL fold metallo-hydrolase [Oscillospiraceae bacterium]|nr:MBL fold metallo-hydrolase [Oscillospiraceae bacterium]